MLWQHAKGQNAMDDRKRMLSRRTFLRAAAAGAGMAVLAACGGAPATT
ncbi:MAG TPA: twin-arginine translocation signal domain-containing protein, partial [Roseiflexaceae bacterium]|nr:twin-arginine translocation signal domain-containing protein [Roseiflexaceae bacterium]